MKRNSAIFVNGVKNKTIETKQIEVLGLLTPHSFQQFWHQVELTMI